MPSMAPRESAAKKQEQLERRVAALKFARGRNEPLEKLKRRAEDVRAGWIGLLKAQLHWLNEQRMNKAIDSKRVAGLEREMQEWTAKPVDEILREYDGVE